VLHKTDNSLNPKEKIRALVSNFRPLNPEEVELIVEKTVAINFKKGEILLREGQIPSKCYMVVEGCVREYLIKDGEEKSTAFYTESETFTPQSDQSKPSKHYWECAEDCVLTVSTKSYEEELQAILPRLELVFRQIAIDKIHLAKAEWSEFISSSPEERYLNLQKTKPSLFDRVPHHQIASFLGMKPQSLSRIRKRISDTKNS